MVLNIFCFKSRYNVFLKSFVPVNICLVVHCPGNRFFFMNFLIHFKIIMFLVRVKWSPSPGYRDASRRFRNTGIDYVIKVPNLSSSEHTFFCNSRPMTPHLVKLRFKFLLEMFSVLRILWIAEISYFSIFL